MNEGMGMKSRMAGIVSLAVVGPAGGQDPGLCERRNRYRCAFRAPPCV